MPIVMNTNMIEPTRNSALKYWAKSPTVIVRMRVTSAFHGSGDSAVEGPSHLRLVLQQVEEEEREQEPGEQPADQAEEPADQSDEHGCRVHRLEVLLQRRDGRIDRGTQVVRDVQ